MKNKIITLIVITFLSISCSKDEEVNCQERIDEINEYYNQQIILADGNSLKIELLIAERDIKLRKACN